MVVGGDFMKIKKFYLVFLFFILSGCGINEQTKVVKKEVHLPFEKQSNFIWTNEKEIYFLQLEEKNNDLIGLLTVSKMSEKTYNLVEESYSLKGTRIGNKFSLHNENEDESIKLSGKIDDKNLIINDENGERIYKPLSEEKFDIALNKLKEKIPQLIKETAEAAAKKYYEEHYIEPYKNIKFYANDRQGDIIMVQLCQPIEEKCVTENWFKIDLKTGTLTPQYKYEDWNAEKYAQKYYKNINGNIPEIVHFYSDHEENGLYIVRVYEIHPDHEATIDWYEVNINTGEVNSIYDI